jgi:hypothetical protein
MGVKREMRKIKQLALRIKRLFSIESDNSLRKNLSKDKHLVNSICNET